MKNRLRRNLVTLVALALLQASPAFAKKTIKIGTVAPASTPWADSLEQIKNRVNKESNGELEIKTYLGGQLGGELEILRGIRGGRIQGGGLTSAALASAVPELDVVEIPYLFSSDSEADFVLDNYLLEPFKKLFEEKGLVLVTWAENGWRDIGLKTKFVKTPDDLKAVKIRSQESKTHLEFWKKMGASPVAMAIPEVLPALQTGIIQGFDNTPLFTLSAEWHSAIKFYTVTQHIYQPAAIVYSKGFWDKLSDNERKILMGEANGMAPPARSAVRALRKELIGVMKDSGVQIYTQTETERNKFRDATKDLAAHLVRVIGGKASDILKTIHEGKKAFAADGKQKSGKN